MSRLRLEIRELESPNAAYIRTAGELLDDLTAEGGGLIVVPGPSRAGTDVFMTKLSEVATAEGGTILRSWADPAEHDLPLSFLERFPTNGDPPLVSPDLDSARNDPQRAATLLADWLMAFAQRHVGSAVLPVIAIENAQWIDSVSAAALQYAIPRIIHRGLIVAVGIGQGGSRGFPDSIERASDRDRQGRTVLLPSLRYLHVQRHFSERFGFPLGADSARFVLNSTAGLLGAVNDVFDEITPADLDSIRSTRQIPGEVFARMAAFSTPVTDRDPRLTVFEEICAALGTPVPKDAFIRIADRLGVVDLVPRALHEAAVVQIPATGDFCLRIPSQRLQVFDAGDDDQLRRVHAAIAAEGIGNTASHRVLSAPVIDDAVVARLLADARALECSGRPRDASVAIRAGDLSADSDAVALQLLCEGIRTHIRHLITFQHDDFVTRLDGLDDPVEARYLALWVHFLSPHGATAHDERLAFASASSDCEAHLWMRHDIATLAALESYATSDYDGFAEACAIARRLLDDCAPTPPDDMWWVSLDGRRLILDAFELAADAIAPGADAPSIRARAAAIAARAGTVENAESDAFDALAICAMIEFSLGSLAQCSEYVDQAETHGAPGFATPVFGGAIAQLRALACIYRGEWDTAVVTLDDAMLHMFEARDPQVKRTLPMIAAYLASARGELDRAEELLEFARQSFGGDTHPLGLAHFMPLAEGEYAMQVGGFEQVIDALEPYADGTVFGAELWLTEAYAALGRADDARASLERTRALMRAPFDELPTFLDHAEGAVALVTGDRDGAIAAFRRGVDGANAPLERAKCELSLARVLGDTPEAHALIDAALGGLRQIGAHAYVRRVEWSRDVLTAARRRRVDSLSNREREVAELAALGCSNPEIADRLSISRSTAAFHISRILEKLSLSNRREIADELGTVAGDAAAERTPG